MLQKLLIVCVFGAICWQWSGAAEADVATHEAGASAVGQRATEDAAATPAARRIALVIGNAEYPQDAIANPVKDARAMDEALRLLGFEVMRHENLNRAQMRDAIRAFRRRLAAGGTGLFYFAGHGMRVADQTLLLALDSDSHAPASLLTQSTDLRSVLESMSGPRPGKLNLVILDTCLNTPFGTASGMHVGSPDLPEQTLVAFATAAGSFAADGARHGLYTAELLKAMAVPGQDIRQVLQRVAAAVRQASAQRQAPWISSSLQDGTRFVMATQAATRAGALWPAPDTGANGAVLTLQSLQSRGVLPKDSAEQYELTFWESIKDSTHASDYEAYLKAYPNGRFASLARARIERLRAAAPKAEQPAQPSESKPAKTAPERARPAPAAKTPERPRPSAKAPPQASPAPAAPPQEAASAPPTAAGGEVKDCPGCPEMIALPAGAFTMGSNSSDPSEKPAHHVSIKAPFAIGKYEVTVAQWDACVEAGACQRVTSDGNRAKNTPARDLSWDDAQQYVAWLSKLSGKPYRLPTEAEWEYAARGGTKTRYWWGEQMRKGNANCKECGEPWQQDSPAPVGSFAANPYGLHDVVGSVWEWVSDCWHNSYKAAPADGRAWDEPNCRVRVIRGGSWREGASYMPTTTRFKYDANVRHTQNGFRVARDMK